MRILVTGSSGFVGSHVVEEFARQGHDLRLTLRPRSRLDFLEGLDFERVEADLRDAEALLRAVDGIEAVVHLAGLTAALTEAEYFAVNAQGTASLARAAVDAGVSRFVYLSSLSAQGPSPDGNGSMPAVPRPVSVYGRSKLAGEEAVLGLRERMSVAVVRSPVVYGPRDKGLLPFFKLVRLRIAPIYGDGSNRFSWVHAHDFAAAIAASIDAKSSGSVYTIADGPSHSWRELADAFGKALGRRPFVIQVPPSLYSFAGTAGSLAAKVARRPLLLNRDKIAEMRQPYWTCNNDAITKELGWKPVVGIEEGLQSTVHWYQEHRWL